MKEERLDVVVVVVGCFDFMGEFCFFIMFMWMKGNEY